MSELFQQPWPEGEYRFFQLGFVVDDVVAAARRWSTLFGVGPFHVLPVAAQECTYRGEPSSFEVRIAVAQAGPAQIELIEQRSTARSVYTERPITFHQLCTLTTDYEATRDRYVAMGYEVACEMTARNGQHVAYVDTFEDFGFYTEVVSEVPGFVDQLAAIARTCRDWDGTDPVRLLTRDGYRVPED